MHTNLESEYWERRYQSGQTGWDLGQAAPPLRDFLSCHEDRTARVLVPGAGYGHEVLLLQSLGFRHVTVLDVAPTPLETLRRNLGEGTFQVCEEDFFSHRGRYDLILEHTFFCALDPALRPAYVRKMKELLVPGGLLAGLLFNRDFPINPPFGGSATEYRALFGSDFELLTLAACSSSALPRQGSELFFIFRKPQHP